MTQVSEALESLDEIDEKLHYGGPVDMNGVYIIHRAEIPNRINILNGIFYGGDINSLSSLFNTKQIGSNDIKFFLGYSSWIPNQLTFELKRRSWVIYENATPELIFEMNEDEMWKKILYDMGDKYKVFANYPDNPSLN